ncbi:S-layer homology domain-containing protein [Paenibacillus sp. NPDC058071]|uniref:S-layer homology domain-containing protein n=1 Tax=Paenibacillus sp. NPDC058071 TaxID=3346326 RepID=UPI0036DC0D19
MRDYTINNFELEVNELYKQINNKYAKMLAVVLSIAIVFGLFNFPLVPTASAAGPLPAPQNVQVTGVTHTSITLEWDPVVGVDQNTGYQIWYSNGGWAAWVATPTATVGGLNPNTTYSFYVTAISAANDRSAIVTTTTDAVPSAPQVTSVSVPADGTYSSGQDLAFTVNFDQAIYVDTTNGTPTISLVIGMKVVRASYVSGSGGSALSFRYTVQRGDSDSNGITVGALVLNGGTIKNSYGNTDASLTLNSIGSTAGVLVNAPFDAATVSTDPVTNVTSTSADVGGDVTDDGGAAVTERGIVYSTSSNPTVADTKVIVAGKTGKYTSNLTGLTTETTYHVRAFATNSVGTSYGNNISFTTLASTPPTVIGMSLDKHTGTMQVGDTLAVAATAAMSDATTQDVTSLVTWTADDPSKVAIHNGVITALQSGTVKVQATYSGDSAISDYINLTITNPASSNGNNSSNSTPAIAVTSVTINSVTDSVYKGSTLSLVAVVLPKSATNSLVVWSVKPGTGIATISPSGLLKGVANGTVTVVATSTDGTQIHGSKVITVVEPPASASPIFTTVVNTAKVISELTKKLEDSKGLVINFKDADSHWANKTIKLFTKLGVVKGYEDGSFRPNDSITRGEFAAIIYRVFGLTDSTSTELLDVKGHWAEESIIALSSNGVISGYPDGTFKPDRPITRAEMISIISKLVVLKTNPSQDIFKDIDGIWNKDQITAAATMGLVKGQSTDRFAPQSNATRAEALTIILHALELDSSLKILFEQ